MREKKIKKYKPGQIFLHQLSPCLAIVFLEHGKCTQSLHLLITVSQNCTAVSHWDDSLHTGTWENTRGITTQVKTNPGKLAMVENSKICYIFCPFGIKFKLCGFVNLQILNLHCSNLWILKYFPLSMVRNCHSLIHLLY